MRITAVLLAAGRASRMGNNKLFLPYKNHSIIEEVLHQLSRSSVENVLVVTGFERERIEDLVAGINDRKLSVICNEKYESGRIESIKCAIVHLRGRPDGALFMVADKPTVSADLIDRSIEEFKKKKPGILYVMTPAGRGHPIIFSRDLFEEMMSLAGENVIEEFINKHQNEVVELEDAAIQVNINTPEDYERFQKSL